MVYFITDTFKSVVIALIVNVRCVNKLAVGDKIANILGTIHTEPSGFTANLFQFLICQPKLNSFCSFFYIEQLPFIIGFFTSGVLGGAGVAAPLTSVFAVCTPKRVAC